MRTLLLMCISLLPISSFASDECSIYKLKLSTAKKQYFSGEPVVMNIKVVNTSHSSVSIPATLEPQDYWLKLEVAHNGSNLKYIGPEKKIKDFEIFSSVRPGYYYGREIILNNYFDLRNSGTYFLKVTYGIGPDLSTLSQGICVQTAGFRVKRKGVLPQN